MGAGASLENQESFGPVVIGPDGRPRRTPRLMLQRLPHRAPHSRPGILPMYFCHSCERSFTHTGRPPRQNRPTLQVSHNSNSNNNNSDNTTSTINDNANSNTTDLLPGQVNSESNIRSLQALLPAPLQLLMLKKVQNDNDDNGGSDEVRCITMWWKFC